MDYKLKQKWVDELRSGKYEQGEGALRCDRKYCCLAVLGEVVMGLEIEPYGGHFIDAEVRNQDGAWSEYPELPLDAETQSALITMNDAEKKSFPEIADYIEQNL